MRSLQRTVSAVDEMGVFIVRRVFAALLTLFIASIVVFLGVRALPGDPALVLAGSSSKRLRSARRRAIPSRCDHRPMAVPRSGRCRRALSVPLGAT
jgi:hypothetical protein